MKKSNENILYGLLKANFAQAGNADVAVRKRSCLNAIVICRMLARLLLSDLFDICERIRAARRSAELAKNEGVVFLMTPALLKRMRDERDEAERWVIHLAEIMFGLLELWQKNGATFEEFCNLCNRRPNDVRAELLDPEDATSFEKLAFVYNIDYRDTGSGFIEDDVDAPFTHLAKERFLYQIQHKPEARAAAHNALQAVFPEIWGNAYTTALGEDGEIHLFDKDGADAGILDGGI